jgi:branched-chain amino acid transport system substrate-binding protein
MAPLWGCVLGSLLTVNRKERVKEGIQVMNKRMIGQLVVLLGAMGLVTGCGSDEKSKDKIVFGHVTSVTGPFAVVSAAYDNVYDMWIEDVNKAGGIYVKEYGKKLPIELKRYDDASDVNQHVTLLEKVIVDDKVDMLLPPIGTDNVYAAAPIANNHGYVLLAPSGGARKLKEIAAGLPYFFSMLNFADTQMPALADVFAEIGVKKVAITAIQDLHGVEYTDAILPALTAKGIQYTTPQTVPLGTTDFSALYAQATADQVDAWVAFSYPGETIAMVTQAQAAHVNFKAFYATVLIQYPDPVRDTPIFGGVTGIQGLMGAGAWNSKSSPAAKAFEDEYTARWGKSPEYWGALPGYATVEIIQQAIEQAGTLNQAKIRDFIAANTITTAMGPVYFVGGMNQTYAGQVGQWQGSVFEVIDTGAHRTAPPIYPKPAW